VAFGGEGARERRAQSTRGSRDQGQCHGDTLLDSDDGAFGAIGYLQQSVSSPLVGASDGVDALALQVVLMLASKIADRTDTLPASTQP